MATKEEVENFLTTLKNKIRFFGIVFRSRDKNIQSLATLDITPAKRLEYINNLKSNNYYDGPKMDTYDPKKPEYFEFGILINKIEVYIKISVGMTDKSADCMSFHIAELPISYPLQNTTT